MNLTVFEKNIDRLGLISPELVERTILWFSSYAGFQHVLWTSLGKCDSNKQAFDVITMIDEHWKQLDRAAPILAADLVSSVRWCQCLPHAGSARRRTLGSIDIFF
jgi:hypothetical protein